MLSRPTLFSLLSRGHQRCLFHDTPIASAQDDLYAILQVAQDATPSEVKKSFYALSKTHHPDHNPSDPLASQRFVKISEAYAVLSIPAKRREYDSTLSGPSSSLATSKPRGSYHSHSPAGGRPASGLSSRRTQFRGPPPSFYRSGGWGVHEEKRRAAQSQNVPREDAAKIERRSAGVTSGYYGGMGPGQTPFGAENDVRHFDRDAHYRRQENQEQRREKRRRQERGDVIVKETKSQLLNMVVLGGALGLVLLLPPFMSKDEVVLVESNGKGRGKTSGPEIS